VGSRNRRRGRGGRRVGARWAALPRSVPVDFHHLLFSADSASAAEAETAKGTVGSVEEGDKVITSSGIWGTITNLGKETVTLQIADNTKIKMQRDYIAQVRSDDEDKDKDS
jgi:preprotein translocase subunit YajC